MLGNFVPLTIMDALCLRYYYAIDRTSNTVAATLALCGATVGRWWKAGWPIEIRAQLKNVSDRIGQLSKPQQSRLLGLLGIQKQNVTRVHRSMKPILRA